MGDEAGNSWVLLGKELRGRLVFPLKHWSFFGFFLVGVVGLGGLGIWFEVFSEHAEDPTPEGLLRTALLATFLAIAGPACMQVVWSDAEKYLKTFAMFVLAVVLGLAILFARPSVADATAICVYWWLTALSMLMWWLANAYQPELLDIDAPTGGNPGRDLPGDLSGLKH